MGRPDRYKERAKRTDGNKTPPAGRKMHRVQEITPGLLTALRNGDHTAFNVIYTSYLKTMVDFITPLLSSREEAKEVVQDVFAYIWEERSAIEDNMKFRGFMYGTARNMALNILRQKKIHDKYHEESLRSFAGSPTGADKLLEGKEFDEILQRTLENMPPQRKRVFMMSRFEGKSYEEIGRELGISPGTVHKHIKLALSDIRSMLSLIAILMLCLHS